MAIDLVKNILETEKEADKIRNDARGESEKMIKQAKEKTKKRVDAEITKRENEIIKAVKKALKKADEKIEKIEKAQKEEEKEITTESKKNFEKAVQLLMKEMYI